MGDPQPASALEDPGRREFVGSPGARLGIDTGDRDRVAEFAFPSEDREGLRQRRLSSPSAPEPHQQRPAHRGRAGIEDLAWREFLEARVGLRQLVHQFGHEERIAAAGLIEGFDQLARWFGPGEGIGEDLADRVRR